uniref:Uncharacterized protein n=1 Tax=Anopheles albimanus TaxID=7167 RepID=A0A182FY45_ANOAL
MDSVCYPKKMRGLTDYGSCCCCWQTVSRTPDLEER